MISTEAVMTMWLESKRLYLKRSTLEQYRRTIHKTLIENHGIYNLSKFNAEIQSTFVESLVKKYKLQTAKNTITLLNQFFDFAYEKKLTKAKIVLCARYPSSRPAKIDVLSVLEQKKLTKYLLDNLDCSKLGILLCLYSGLRLGEICGLQWKNFDFANQTIKVEKTIQRISCGNGNSYFLISTPKTQSSEREIPMPKFLVKYFIKNGVSENPEAYIATGTEFFIQPRTYQNRLKSYFKKCGLPEYHFHTLRHTFASRAVELGFEIKALSEVLGHSSTKITLDLYVHPSMELKRKEMQKLSAII